MSRVLIRESVSKNFSERNAISSAQCIYFPISKYIELPNCKKNKENIHHPSIQSFQKFSFSWQPTSLPPPPQKKKTANQPNLPQPAWGDGRVDLDSTSRARRMAAKTCARMGTRRGAELGWIISWVSHELTLILWVVGLGWLKKISYKRCWMAKM